MFPLAFTSSRRRPREKIRRAAPTVVFVHGSLDRSTSFMRTARRLADLNCVVSTTGAATAGPGNMGRPRPMWHGHVDDLLSLIDGRRVSLVGHSSRRVDRARGSRTRSVGHQGHRGLRSPLPWFDWWPSRSRVFVTEDPGDFAQGFFETTCRSGIVGEVERPSEGGATCRRAGTRRGAGGDPRPTSRSRPRQYLGSDFRRTGSRSLEHHRRAAEVVAESVPGAQLVEIEGAAHGAHLAHPDAFGRVRQVSRELGQAADRRSSSPSIS